MKKVIIDSDMGWDDVLSIAYLMKDPGVEIIGLTVTGCGETDLGWGTIIAQHLLGIGNHSHVPVARGTDVPLALNNVFPQLFKNDMNDIMGLLGSLNPKELPTLSPKPAWEFLHDTLKSATGKVTILSLGGFTNFAKLLDLKPAASDLAKIERIHAMAGAVYVDGNVAALNGALPAWDQGSRYSSNHYAEWNVFVDPLATDRLLKSELPLTLVPLDACNQVILDASYEAKITATDPVANLVRGIFDKKTHENAEGNLPVPIFDPLATLLMTGAVTANKVDSQYLSVELGEHEHDNHCGQLRVETSGSRKVDIVLGVSQTQFARQFAQVINAEA